MPFFPSSILSSFLCAFRAGDYGRVVDASLPGDEVGEMARRKDETTTGRKVEPRSPSEKGARPAVLRSCRPSVGGPKSGAGGFAAARSPERAALDVPDRKGEEVFPEDARLRAGAEDGAGAARRPVDAVAGATRRPAGAGGEPRRRTPPDLRASRVPSVSRNVGTVFPGPEGRRAFFLDGLARRGGEPRHAGGGRAARAAHGRQTLRVRWSGGAQICGEQTARPVGFRSRRSRRRDAAKRK